MSMLWLRRIAQRYLLAKPISVPKQELRELAGQLLDRWLMVMSKVRTRRDEETDSPSMWSYGHKLYDSTMLTGLQVTPVDSRSPMAILVAAKLGRPKPGRTYAVGGEMLHRSFGGSRARPFQLEILFSPLISPTEYKANRQAAEREIYSILIHEFTHARDFMPDKDKGTKGLADQGKSVEYHNHPAEVRAFTQQIVDEVEEYIRKSVRTSDGGNDTWGLKDNPTALIKRALDNSFTWQRIYQNLTPTNKKMILRNVGQRAIAQFEELVAEFGEG